MKTFTKILMIMFAMFMSSCNKGNEAVAQTTMSQKMYITIDGVSQPVTLYNNAATQALVERLENGNVTVTLNSSGGFEIWGALGFSLPTSNEQITAQPGDVILYNGSNICLMYGSNSWSYTRLGHIDALNESELRSFLKAGESNIEVTLSLQATTQPTSNTLVIYYSYTNKCHEIVQTLTSQIDADVLRIYPADKNQQYEANGYAIGMQLLNTINANPNSADSYPEIDPVSTSLDEYDTFIIVTPLWWSQMAAILQTYLFHHGAEMAGKNVGLIVSSHSSGISGVMADAERLIPDANWMGDALWINNANHGNRATLIQNWLTDINYSAISTIIEDVNIDSNNALKGIYNLNGQRLTEAPESGIYIENGIKKIATKK
ncbi:MAG: NAD(P)H-dependent oxidoreductase [Muribaculaceae bacterium]|nr:NAD(P)H-dependent oxidoreductase [Muribaculaceae bacterium]